MANRKAITILIITFGDGVTVNRNQQLLMDSIITVFPKDGGIDELQYYDPSKARNTTITTALTPLQIYNLAQATGYDHSLLKVRFVTIAGSDFNPVIEGLIGTNRIVDFVEPTPGEPTVVTIDFGDSDHADQKEIIFVDGWA